MSRELQRMLEEVGRDCLCQRSRMAARAVTRRYNAVLAGLDLEVTEFTLLGALAYGGAVSITELADRLAFERTTLVRNLKRLAERGLIEPAGETGRAVRYVPTRAGEELLRKALPLWKKAQASLRKQLRDTDAAAVLLSLNALTKATTRGH